MYLIPSSFLLFHMPLQYKLMLLREDVILFHYSYWKHYIGFIESIFYLVIFVYMHELP